ncbi:MAG: Ppx/GppA family phosphatase [Spirochaetes bacterium]|nr:Ppx/GppA family phosphatase [Spirochaetota bacterium]
MNTFATIDTGSYQVLILIAAVYNGEIKEVVIDRGRITGLGEGVNATGVLNAKAQARTFKAMEEFRSLLDKYGVEKYYAAGTSALREAKNSSDFIEKVKEKTGIAIDIISGEEEARLSFMAAAGGLNLKNKETVIIDIGGGSTEFIFGQGDKILKRFSTKLGVLKLTERFLKSDPVTEDEFYEMMNYLKNELKNVNPPPENPFLVGMGGTMTGLSAIKHKLEKYDPEIVQGSCLDLKELNGIIDDLKSRTVEKRKEIKGLQPGRAEVILAGAAVLKSIMRKAGADEITISDMGLRHGLMFDKFCCGNNTGRIYKKSHRS